MTESPGIYSREKTVASINDTGKMDKPHAKKKKKDTGPLSYTKHKHQLKMD